MQLPSNVVLTRVRPSIYIPLCVCVWSCISAATAGTHSYSSLVAVRFFLGTAKAPFFPGAFYLLSCWYTRKELALRTAVRYSGLALATAFSGLLAAGIFSGPDGKRGIEGEMALHHRRHRKFCHGRPRALHPPRLLGIRHWPRKLAAHRGRACPCPGSSCSCRAATTRRTASTTSTRPWCRASAWAPTP